MSKLDDLQRFPVTGILLIGAAATFLAETSGRSVEHLMLLPGRPVRLAAHDGRALPTAPTHVAFDTVTARRGDSLESVLLVVRDGDTILHTLGISELDSGSWTSFTIAAPWGAAALTLTREDDLGTEAVPWSRSCRDHAGIN